MSAREIQDQRAIAGEMFAQQTAQVNAGAPASTLPGVTMIFEDFAEFNLAGIPSVDVWVGAVNPEKFAAAQQSSSPLPQLHSAIWAPDYAPTLKMAITVETTELLELLEH